MKHSEGKKMFYLFIVCITLSVVIVGATLAYFTASATDDTTVHGDSATVSFSLNVEKITSIDNAFGLIPMKNDQAPGAAQMKCEDDFGNGGCQIYKVTVNADTDTVMFLDGYIVMIPNDERVETRFASVYTDDDGENFYTAFSPDDFINRDTLNSSFIASNDKGDLGIATGACEVSESLSYNHSNASNCLFVENQKIGGDVGRELVFYVMVWVYDNGEAQNYLQGMQLAYTGNVVFTTADGNQISASFD